MTWTFIFQLVVLTWCAVVPVVLFIGVVIERIVKAPRPPTLEHKVTTIVAPNANPPTGPRAGAN